MRSVLFPGRSKLRFRQCTTAELVISDIAVFKYNDYQPLHSVSDFPPYGLVARETLLVDGSTASIADDDRNLHVVGYVVAVNDPSPFYFGRVLASWQRAGYTYTCGNDAVAITIVPIRHYVHQRALKMCRAHDKWENDTTIVVITRREMLVGVL